jgi:hypothetical protein
MAHTARIISTNGHNGYFFFGNPIHHQRIRLKSPRITKIKAIICAGEAI